MDSLVLRYLHSDFERDITHILRQYHSIIEAKEIGRSVQQRPIMQYSIGKGAQRVHISASHHAREWITSWLVVQQLHFYSRLYHEDAVIEGHSVRELLDMISLHFVPMVNPDGVILATEGWVASQLPYDDYAAMAAVSGIGNSYWLWKANIRGIDLNRQYPMNWEAILHSPLAPAAMNYKGDRHSSEPEVWSLMKEIMAQPPLALLAYHSAGEEIYWYHGQEAAYIDHHRGFAERLSEVTGYALIPEEEHVAGGFADWFVASYLRPGFTIEVGQEPHPVDLRQCKKIWEQNKYIPFVTAQYLLE